jgi:hypothetical protein
MTDFLKVIETKLKVANDSIPFINCGGCASFAIELYDVFKKLGISSKIYVLSHDNHGVFKSALTDAIENNSVELQYFNKRGVYFNHVVVEAAGYVYDSEGICPNIESMGESWQCNYIHEIDYELAKKLANSPGWNQMFNRDNIQKIREILNN